ncbi:SRPBCC family protein [Parvularcula sp. IMCC14364]|uniref:SRPBCC family protein n=1 Tax=Parvularcula sp. IMCC14364 TaxID=3067902 RepID=UPI002740EA81|nr:SRPBCC family protein [Parvularcula sp. IMCC14364]
MKLLQKIMTGFAAFMVIIYIAGFFLDDEVSLTRNILIEAPREQVFELVADFNNWNAWSPWNAFDPDAIYDVTGMDRGQRMVWASDHPAIGEGAQTVVFYEPPRMIETRLDLGGWGDGYGAFVLIENEKTDSTRIYWQYNGEMRRGKPFLLKPVHTYYGLFMDEMLAPTYERGLQQLKELAERQDLSAAMADAELEEALPPQ